MSRLLDLGRRVELQSMDTHFHEITVALYRQEDLSDPLYTVHSYSQIPGCTERIHGLVSNMIVLGDLAAAGPSSFKFTCGQDHPLAVRRVFLESCKIPTRQPVPAAASSVLDRKSGLRVHAESLGQGQYRISASGEDVDDDTRQRRIGVIVNGLRKLGEMQAVADSSGDVLADCVSFSCGQSHDALVALLLQRAPNVRALVREEAAAAARGVLAAPSAQS